MKALWLTSFDGPHSFDVRESDDPQPSDDEVLVHVQAVCVNRLELQVMANLGPGRALTPPLILGMDPSGYIDSCGSGVTGYNVGDRVVIKPNIPCGTCHQCKQGRDNLCAEQPIVGIHRPGGFAEFVAVPVRNVTKIPDSITYETASAASHSVPIALQMIEAAGGLREQIDVLISGASGAIGVALVQLAAMFGARVFAVTGNDRKRDRLEGLGAHAVFNQLITPEFAAQIKDQTESKGVDVFFDCVGDSRLIKQGFQSLSQGGKAVFCGNLSGQEITVSLPWLFRRRASLIGSSSASYRVYARATEYVARGAITPEIDCRFPMDQISDAYQRLRNRDHFGKIVLGGLEKV